VQWVLSEYRVASLTLLLDNGLSVDQKLATGNEHDGMVEGKHDLLRRICGLQDQARSLPLARLLISRGADTVAKHISKISQTVLHYATDCKNYGMAELLLAHGVDVNARTKGGEIPLHFVCYDSSPDTKLANMLIAHGADIEARDEEGNSPVESLLCLFRSFPCAGRCSFGAAIGG
jgi:hypothetical protein